jgi:hypothetical protein
MTTQTPDATPTDFLGWDLPPGLIDISQTTITQVPPPEDSIQDHVLPSLFWADHAKVQRIAADMLRGIRGLTFLVACLAVLQVFFVFLRLMQGDYTSAVSDLLGVGGLSWLAVFLNEEAKDFEFVTRP